MAQLSVQADRRGRIRFKPIAVGRRRLNTALCPILLSHVIELHSNGSNTEVLQALNARGVDYLLIGGLACVFYGCRDKFEVDDLDVLLDPSPDNMRKLSAAFQDLGVEQPGDPSQLARPAVQIPLKQYHYMDVVTPPLGSSFEALSHGAHAATVNDVPLRVVSRQGLVTLKRAAVALGTDASGKHAADLARLTGA